MAIQIIEENRKPSKWDAVFEAVGQGTNAMAKSLMGEQRKKSISNVLGPEAANLPPEFQKIAYEAKLKSEASKQSSEGLKGFLAGLGGEEGMKIDPSGITDEQIIQADLMKKGLGSQLRNLRNDALSQREREEKSDEKHQERIREKESVKRLLRETGDYDEEELEEASKVYDVPTARQLLLNKKEPSPYEPTSKKLAAQRTNKFIDSVMSKSTSSKEKQRALEIGMSLSKAGATGYKLQHTLAEYFQNPALDSPEAKIFNAAMKSQYHGFGDIVKGKVSDNEFKTLGKRIAAAEDSPQAAEGLILTAMMENAINIKEGEIVERLRQEYFDNGESEPPNFDIIVNKELRPYADLIVAKTNNDLLNLLNPTKKNSPNQEVLNGIWGSNE
jgi:hypothetical protein